jgi:hypothetical protein
MAYKELWIVTSDENSDRLFIYHLKNLAVISNEISKSKKIKKLKNYLYERKLIGTVRSMQQIITEVSRAPHI